MKIMIIFAVLSFFTLCVSCEKDENYRAFLYQNRNDLTQHIESGPFKSAEEARSWIYSNVSRLNLSEGVFDYEIGRNCSKESGFTLWVCEDTFR